MGAYSRAEWTNSQSFFATMGFLSKVLFAESNCCNTIHVDLSNEVETNQPNYTGVYHVNKWINGREYWVQADGERAIWYVPEFKDWAIGYKDDLGSNFRSLATASSVAADCPYDTRNNWKYWNGSLWVSPINNADIRCQSG